jgi:hypothetical protein
MEKEIEKKVKVKKHYQTALSFTEEEANVLEILRTKYTMIYVFRRGMEVCLGEMAKMADVDAKKLDEKGNIAIIPTPKEDDEYLDKNYSGFDLGTEE